MYYLAPINLRAEGVFVDANNADTNNWDQFVTVYNCKRGCNLVFNIVKFQLLDQYFN